MPESNRTVFRRVTAAAAGALLTIVCSHAFAGAEAVADKEVAQQQVAADNSFPLHFALSIGGDSEFVFRGVDILPEVDINVDKAVTEAVNAVPGFRQFLASAGLTPKQFVALGAASSGTPSTPVLVSRESGIYYADGNVSGTFRGTTITLGVFYGTQAESRIQNSFFGNKPVFDSYHEFDSYLSVSREVGPVRISLGGTFYHVINNTDFDTAELNFGVAYTPPKFQYVSASFSYNYAGAFNFADYNEGGVKGEYIDGHYLEARIDGNIPLYKHVITFNPYILVSAGSGIMPRAFDPANLPTFSNTERYAKSIEAYVDSVLQYVKSGGTTTAPSDTSLSATRTAYDPTTLDRSFDLSNFQAGFRVPFYLTRYITIRGDFNYSRPLGNLDREPYNQKDQIWGGGVVTLSF